MTIHPHQPPKLKKEYINTSTPLLGLFYGEIFAFTFTVKLLYAPLRIARIETYTGSHQNVSANTGTRVCPITLVCSELYKFILVRKFCMAFCKFCQL